MLFKRFRKLKQLKKIASVYVSDKHNHIIIVPRYENETGVYYEQEACLSFEMPLNPLDLGTEVIKALNNYCFREAPASLKLTDWPAFKAGKSRSVSAFEKEYIYIHVGSLNVSNLVLEICGYPEKDSELTINSTISFFAPREELGARIMKVYATCLTGKLP
ncbi:MAG: hypothetical protein IPH88_17375 [Bacteroidales bacterium]|nr:hypothetical protein [Bacteroidales bacterium]